MLSVFLFVVCWAVMLPGAEILSEEWQYMERKGAPGQVRGKDPLRISPRVSAWRDDYPHWRALNREPLRSNEVYRIRFTARAVRLKPEETAFLKLIVNEKGSSLRSPLLRCGPAPAAQQEEFAVSFTTDRDLGPGELELILQHGWGDRRVEVEDVRVEHLGAEKSPEAFRRTGRWYRGQEPRSAWRKQAARQIEKHRKGALRVTVTDGQGAPVPGAEVIIEQQRHAYRFGTAVNSSLIRWLDPSQEMESTLRGELEWYRSQSGRPDVTFEQRRAEAERYFEEIPKHFNYAVLENGMKWKAWAGEWGEYSRETTLRMVDWLHEHGIGVKGHVLVWPGWKNSPEFLREMAGRPKDLEAAVARHIDDLGAALNGKIVTMDVLNEAFNNHDYMDILGDRVMAEWFKQARVVLPDVQLNVNDFLLMANGGRWTEKLDFYDGLIRDLLRADAPLDAIGFQCHFRHNFLTEPERVWELCDRFGRHGLPLACSEFDANIRDEFLQADYTRDFMTAWFAHPSTSAFVLWGFWQGMHWLPYAGSFDLDWRMKENMKAYRDLVFNRWWTTKEEATTDDGGVASLRGFRGTYRVTVRADGRETVLEQVPLDAKTAAVTVPLR